ncbi:L-lactate permease [Clostridium sp. MSJ-11]|uniref:L-lactate permease n=1 Tax=Clostridium mobile TaxID=2841512 RepID=A0ABS6EI20_9CLOT|nr:L-lactate permease [Clostridium mobile]MBU5484860.1 L-lactate permease [Clostridium mobile]
MNEYLLFLVALIPIAWLMISLGALKMEGHKTCFLTLLITLILAIVFWKMPALDAVTAALEGVALGLWPIMLVIIAAVFTYNVSVHTKSMELIKKMMINISTDKRILVLILAWGFGGFLEAIAGFGTAVAIPASIMAALGFDPVFAAIICLIANTAPTAFGAIGIPVSTLAQITSLDVNLLSYTVTIFLTPVIILIPIILVMLTEKTIKGIKGVVAITLVSGISFAIPQMFIAKHMGADLPSIVGSVSSMICTIIMAKVFYKEKSSPSDKSITFKSIVLAWLPFILVFLFIIFTSPLFPKVNEFLSTIQTSVYIYTGEGAKPFTFLWLATPGTLIIIATFIGGAIQGAKFKDMFHILMKTFKQMSKSFITILSIVALAKVMGYSGMIKSIATILVQVTGKYYPLISPVIGAMGTFVTGSDTSCNVLFGGLQVEVAKSLNLSPYWLAAANTGGATAGKMISPQSIAVATAATGLVGAEGKILNATFKICIFYVIILGLIAYFAAPLFNII